MAKGDILRVRGPGFEHYGIDVGNCTVVHASPEDMGSIKHVSRTEFLRGGKSLEKGRMDIVNVQNAREPDEVVRVALSLVEEGKSWNPFNKKTWNPFTNNCEHFAFFCKTGEYRSKQIKEFVQNTKKFIPAITNSQNTPKMKIASAATVIGFHFGKKIIDYGRYKFRQIRQKAKIKKEDYGFYSEIPYHLGLNVSAFYMNKITGENLIIPLEVAEENISKFSNALCIDFQAVDTPDIASEIREKLEKLYGNSSQNAFTLGFDLVACGFDSLIDLSFFRHDELIDKIYFNAIELAISDDLLNDCLNLLCTSPMDLNTWKIYLDKLSEIGDWLGNSK